MQKEYQPIYKTSTKKNPKSCTDGPEMVDTLIESKLDEMLLVF